MKKVFYLWTNELRSGSKGVAILTEHPSVTINRNFLFMSLSKCAAIQKVPYIPGNFDLTWVGSSHDADKWIKGAASSSERFGTYSSTNLG
jgi:hypothetical protein